MAHNQGADKPQKPLWQAFADSLLNCTEINASSQMQAWQFPKRIEASRAWPRLAHKGLRPTGRKSASLSASAHLPVVSRHSGPS